MVEKTEEKTLKNKINEPLLNVKKIVAIMITVMYEVLSNIVVYLEYGGNETFFMINIVVGVAIIFTLSMLRAAYPEEVPDKSFTELFKRFFRKIADTIYNRSIDNTDKMNALEKMMIWIVREWDTFNQAQLKDEIDYFKKKVKNLEDEI